MTTHPSHMDTYQDNPYVLGIDPGTTNLGWALMNKITLERETSGCFFLRHRNEIQGNDGLLVTEIWRFWTTVILRLPHPPGYVIVEQNAMNRMLSNVETSILTLAVATQMEIAAIHPMTWKKLLGIKATGKHSQNKIEAEDFVRELGYKVPNNHEADAICIALCACCALNKS